MSDWVVVYGSIASPNKETALIHARAHRIEGQNGEVIGKEEIMDWVKAKPE